MKDIQKEANKRRRRRRRKTNTDTHTHILEVQSCHHTKKEERKK
jgi:hypothetical protein